MNALQKAAFGFGIVLGIVLIPIRVVTVVSWVVVSVAVFIAMFAVGIINMLLMPVRWLAKGVVNICASNRAWLNM